MSLPKIRFVIETVSSAHDANGNSYHFATVTSTITGKSATFDHVGGENNAPHMVQRALGGISAVGCLSDFALTFNVKLPKKQWQNARKYRVGAISRFEGEITAALLATLETPEAE